MSTQRHLFIYENPYELSNALIQQWHTLAANAVQERGRFWSALCGGKTMVEFYCRLSTLGESPDFWSKSIIFQTDEWFNQDDAQPGVASQLRDNLINYVNLPPAQFKPIDVTLPDLSICADHYMNEIIRATAVQPPQKPIFDLVMLALDESGQVAGWHPEMMSDHDQRWMVPIMDPSRPRVAMHWSLINMARRVVIVALGAGKARAVAAFLNQDRSCLANHISPQNGSVEIFIDNLASARLNYGDDFEHVGTGIRLAV